MKTFILALITVFTFSIQAAELPEFSPEFASDISSEMVLEEILEASGETTTAMSCVCYRGPGTGQRYSCAPVAKTCYGGPGNYPYTCYVCPQ